MNANDPAPEKVDSEPPLGRRDRGSRKQPRLLLGLALAALSLVGAVFLVRHLFPATPALVGTWENEKQIFAARPGEVQIVLNRNGTGQIDLARNLSWSFDKFTYRVRGDVLEMKPSPDQEVNWRIEVTKDRLRVVGVDDEVLPENQVLVFHRVRGR